MYQTHRTPASLAADGLRGHMTLLKDGILKKEGLSTQWGYMDLLRRTPCTAKIQFASPSSHSMVRKDVIRILEVPGYEVRREWSY